MKRSLFTFLSSLVVFSFAVSAWAVASSTPSVNEVTREACVPPSCVVVFGHVYHVNARRASKIETTTPTQTHAVRTRMKVLVGPDGTRIVASNQDYERCLPPSCYLVSTRPAIPGTTTRPVIESKLGSPFTKLVGFVAADGTLIQPYYDDSGAIIAASGRDVTGVNRRMQFSTNVETQYIPFQKPIRFCNGPNDTGCYPSVSLPPSCDSFGCNVYKTTITFTYSEEANSLFLFKLIPKLSDC
jgi:hypothetical protein